MARTAPNSPLLSPAIPDKFKLPIFLTLIAAGLAGNYFKYPIFLNTDFLFGSIFAMLALQLFGSGRGILAAAIIACYTYFIWNHPYIIIISTAEVAAVSWLMTRRKMGMVLADMLYWLIIGIPLILFLYIFIMHVSFSHASFVMTKQALNGITNALAARLIFSFYVLRSRSAQISYRDIVYNLLVFFVLWPTLILLAVSSKDDFGSTDRNIRSALMRDSLHLTFSLDTWLEDRKTSIVNLAEMAGSKYPQHVQPYLELVKKSDANFQRVGLLNSESITTAYMPLLDELGQNNIGRNYTDRPFIQNLKLTLKPMLSEVLMSKVGNPRPIVSMLVPVVIRGEYGGYAIGVLSMKQIQEELDQNTVGNDTLYTLIDKNDKVIMSNNAAQKIMAPFARGKGTLEPLGNGISQWVPALSANMPISERWKNSFYVAETPVGKMSEWRLILEQPVAPFQKALYDSYAGKMTMLLLILLGALTLAELLSRKIVVDLGKLSTLTNNLPVRLMTHSKETVWPESGIAEINNLVSNFSQMEGLLSDQFNNIIQVNASLEEQTLQVVKYEKELRFIINNVPAGVCFVNERRLQFVNTSFDLIFGYEAGTTKGMETVAFHSISESYERNVQKAYAAVAAGGIYSSEEEMKKSDGSLFWCNIRGQAINVENPGEGSLWMIEDITERKIAETEKLALERQTFHSQKLESLGVLAGGIAHDFNNLLQSILGNVELAIRELPTDSSPRKFIDCAMDSARSAARLTSLMLAYAGKGLVTKKELCLNDLVRKNSELLKTAASPSVSVEFHLPEGLPAIMADESQLQQVVMNLITNAAESINNQSGLVRLSTGTRGCDREFLAASLLEVKQEQGEYLFLEVSDNGCGMDEDTVGRLFEPFFTTKFTGRGLGMSAVMGIMKSHHGALFVESEPGRGTTFRAYFPVSQTALPATVSEPAANLPERATSQEKGPSRLALVVDDEKAVLRVCSKMVSLCGFTVITACDGIDAVAKFREHAAEITVVVMDLTMPKMDGIAAMGEIYRIRPDARVILSSGFNEEELCERVTDQAPSGFIRKPYSMNVLETELNRVIQVKSH